MRLSRRFLLSVLLLLTSVAPVFGQSYTRCWLPRISGFENEHARAESILNGYTGEDLRRLQIYVTAKRFPGNPEPALYLHTNFKGAGQSNALKLAFPKSTLDLSFPDKDINLLSLLDEVLGKEGVTSAGRKYSAYASVYVDSSVFSVFRDLRIGGARNSYAVSSGRNYGRLLEIRDYTGRVRRLIQVCPPPPAARVYVSENLSGRPGHLADLQRASFSMENTELINVVQDASTHEALSLHVPEGVARTLSQDLTKAGFLDALKENPTKSKFVMGHISNGELYLTRDGTQRIALSELEEFAVHEGLSLGIIGCESAVSEAGIVASKFINSVTAAKQFGEALKATNFLDFFQRFSSTDIEVVINESTLKNLSRTKRRAAIRADLFKKEAIGNYRPLPSRQGVITFAGDTLYQLTRRKR
jgi:hypothetical protein